MEDRRTILFLDFRLDSVQGELFHAGDRVAVEPQVLDLIAYLAENSGKVVSRDDLIEHVWGGRIVSDSAIASRLNAARVALGDDGTAQKVIKTIPRRGYRFEVPVSNAEHPRPVYPDKPSIAVLPFDNLSGDPDQSYFSDGVTDDIITDLSRYSELFVVARHSSFAYRNTQKPVAEIARELGVQYIVEGSVRRAGSRIRVTAQLFDPYVGNQLWADRYDRELTDVFEVQDEITGIVVNTLAGQIARQHYIRVSEKRPESVAAYEHLLRASEHVLRIAPADTVLAREEAAKALELDERIARAHAVKALTHVNEGANFWVPDQKAAFQQAFHSARQCVAMDPRDPWGHAMLGISELWFNRAHERAEQNMRRAVDLNPSNAQIRSLYAYVLVFTGAPEKALEEVDTAIRQSPHFPPLFHGFRGRALLILRRFEEAMENLDQMVNLMPGHSNALGYAAVGCVALNRLDQAKAYTAELRRTNEFYRLGNLRRMLPFRHEKDLELIVANLSEAGLPE